MTININNFIPTINIDEYVPWDVIKDHFQEHKRIYVVTSFRPINLFSSSSKKLILNFQILSKLYGPNQLIFEWIPEVDIPDHIINHVDNKLRERQ